MIKILAPKEKIELLLWEIKYKCVAWEMDIGHSYDDPS